MKSPLKDTVEFKSAAALRRMIPASSTVSTLLLYGATMELSLARAGSKVVSHTNKYPVYEFWKCLKEDSISVAAAAQEFHPQIDSELFYFLQQSWAQMGNPFMRSALFFLLNRCSNLGSASAGKIDRGAFNSLALGHLRNFKEDNFYPLWDQTDEPLSVLDSNSQSDYWMIPAGKFSFNLFEQGKSKGCDMTTFNHRELNKRASESGEKLVIVYKTHPHLYKLYKEFNIKMVDMRGRITTDHKECVEMIIANF
tara:strand:+ start:963 stop:1721 length:759 start_codon:yes stop_codon:yes gene_type:complete